MSTHIAKAGLLCLVGLVASAGWPNAKAADFIERVQLDTRSRMEGMGLSSVLLLERVKGAGKEVMAERLLEKLRGSGAAISTGGIIQTEISEDQVIVHGQGGWFLQVWRDGTKARYRNDAYVDGGQNPRLDLDERMSAEDLRQLGLKFVHEQLADFIQLGPGEELVPFKTVYQVDVGGRAGQVEHRAVMAGAVVFSRKVDGIDVVGPGSKVEVIIANDGTPVGFDFDWPRYRKTGRVQSVHPVGKLFERASALGSLSIQPDEVVLERFECGYFDMGVRGHNRRAPIQPGCVAQYLSKALVDEAAYAINPEDGWVVSAEFNVIPAGERVEPDERWPETLALCDRGDVCKASPVSPALPLAEVPPSVD